MDSELLRTVEALPRCRDERPGRNPAIVDRLHERLSRLDTRANYFILILVIPTPAQVENVLAREIYYRITLRKAALSDISPSDASRAGRP